MSDIRRDAMALNLKILESYYEFYDGLYDNGFCLYSNGEIKFKNGLYEVDKKPIISGYKKLQMQFPNETETGLSYAVLTEDECLFYRNKMINLLEKYK